MKAIGIVVAVILGAPACFDANVGDSTALSTMHARWALSLGGGYEDDANVVAIDHAGDVIVGGSFQHTIDFGVGQVASSHTPTVDGGFDASGYVTKRRGTDGAHLWSVIFDPSALGDVHGVGVDAWDNVYVAVDIGVSFDRSNMLLVKLDPLGHELWRRAFEPTSLSNARAGVAVAADGAVLVSGGFDGTIDFGAGPLTDPLDREAATYLAVYEPDGMLRWGTAVLGNGNPNAVALAADGDFVVTGGIGGVMVFGDVVRSPVDRADAFLARYTATGQLRWARVVASDVPGVAGGVGVVTLPGGEIAMSVEENPDTPGSANSASITTFTDSGEPIARGAVTHVVPWSVATTPNGRVLQTGWINGFSADFGSGPIQNALYVALAEDGATTVGAAGFGHPDLVDGVSQAIATRGATIAISGRFGGPLDFGTGVLPMAGGYQDGFVAVFDWSEEP